MDAVAPERIDGGRLGLIEDLVESRRRERPRDVCERARGGLFEGVANRLLPNKCEVLEIQRKNRVVP